MDLRVEGENATCLVIREEDRAKPSRGYLRLGEQVCLMVQSVVLAECRELFKPPAVMARNIDCFQVRQLYGERGLARRSCGTVSCVDASGMKLPARVPRNG